MFRCKLLLGISVVAVLLVSVPNAKAVYVYSQSEGGIVPIVNYSFELPADGKHNAWDIEANAKPYPGNKSSVSDVPGWSSDVTAADSGVESSTSTTDGAYRGFLMGWDDPSVWNITGYKIKAGDQFRLAVDARSTGSATKLKISLFYVDIGGARTTIATTTVDLGTGTPVPGKSPWQTYYLDTGELNVTPPVGRLIGIELENAATGWLGIDKVRFIPEPATMALLGLGGLALIRRKR